MVGTNHLQYAHGAGADKRVGSGAGDALHQHAMDSGAGGVRRFLSRERVRPRSRACAAHTPTLPRLRYFADYELVEGGD